MVSLVEITAFVDADNPLEIRIPTPDAAGTQALLLVERLDGQLGGFETMIVEAADAEERSLFAGASLRISTLHASVTHLYARIHAAAPGWFRARLLWVRGRLPDALCSLCRRTLATLVAAGFALVGVPMPDLTLAEVAPGALEGLMDAMRQPPLAELLERLHPGLPELLVQMIGALDLVRAALDQFYRACCEEMGLCQRRSAR